MATINLGSVVRTDLGQSFIACGTGEISSITVFTRNAGTGSLYLYSGASGYSDLMYTVPSVSFNGNKAATVIDLTGGSGDTSVVAGRNYHFRVKSTADGWISNWANAYEGGDRLTSAGLPSTGSDLNFEVAIITATSPEIDIQRPAGISIADGSADDIGTQNTGTVHLSYTIDNTAGDGQLDITAVTPSNMINADNFTIVTSLPLSVAAGTTGSLDISFGVAAVSVFSLDMALDNNDSDEKPYDISISGSGVANSPLPDVVDGNSLTFDGADDYVEIAYSAEINPSVFSVEVWAKVTFTTGNYQSVITSRDAAFSMGYMFYIDPANKWQLWIGNGIGTTGWESLVGPDIVLNKWTHLAAAYDGTTMSFYVNGVNAGSKAAGFSANTSKPLRIGAGTTEGAPQLFYNGQIDEVRVWNKVLTQTEILSSRCNTLAGNETGLAAYWRFDHDTGTTLMDHTANANHGTLMNSSANTPPADGAAEGPIWTQLADDPCSVSVAPDYALNFDGTNDYVAVPSTLDLRPANNFTIEAWVNIADFTNNPVIIVHDENGGGDDGYNLVINSAGQLYFNPASGVGQVIISDAVLTPGQWHHVAAVYDNSTAKIYVDGVEKTQAFTGDIVYSLTGFVNIGRRGGTFKPGTSPMNGMIDELRFWNVVRTRDEIINSRCNTLAGNETGLAAYWRFDHDTGTTLMDHTANANHGTLMNSSANTPAADGATEGPVWMPVTDDPCSVSVVADSALNFDGTDDYVEIPYSAEINPSVFSVEAWAKVTGTTGDFQSVITSRNDAPSIGYIFYIDPANKWQLWIGNGIGTAGWEKLVGPDIVLNKWTHLAAAYDGTTISFYVNGVNAGSKAAGFSANTSKPLRIGAGSTEGAPQLFYNGQIDEVRVWNKLLTQTEILSSRCNTLAGNETGLTAYWRFDHDTGTTLMDHTANANDGILMNSSANTPAADGTTEGPIWTQVTDNPCDAGPGDVTENLKLWLKADAIALSDGAAITSWTGIGRNPLTAAQGTAAQQPSYTLDALNYNPVVTFDGDDSLAISTADYGPLFPANDESRTLIAVARSGSANDMYIFSYGTEVIYGGYGLRSLAEDAVGENYGINLAGAAGSFPVNNSLLMSYSHDGSLAAGNPDSFLYLNGSLENSDEFDLITANAFDAQVGALLAVAPLRNWIGDIAEIILYGNNLTDAERTNVESYLSLKYGIEKAGNYTDSTGMTLWDAAANAAYHNNVAGIGRDDASTLDQQKSRSVNADAIVTIDKGSAFADDNRFLIWGNDNGLTDEQTTELPFDVSMRIGREWMVSEPNGDMGTVTVQIDASGLALTGTQAILLIDTDGDGDFTSGDVEQVTANEYTAGVATFNNVNLGNNNVFTLATEVEIYAPGNVFTNLALWLKAGEGVYSDRNGYSAGSTTAGDGNSVNSWADSSNSRINAATTANADMNPPILKNNAADNFNFNPVVMFDGVDDSLDFYDDYIFSANTGISIFAVVRPDAASTGAADFIFDFGLHGSYSYGIAYSADFGTLTTAANSGGTGISFNHIRGSQGTLISGIVEFANTQELFFDGVSQGTEPITLTQLTGAEINESPTHVSNGGPVTISRQSKSDLFAGRLFQGAMAEVILYDNLVSPAEKQRIESYLAIKYGISKAGNYSDTADAILWDAAANAAYHNGVTGIGRDDASKLNQQKSGNANTETVVVIDNGNAFTADLSFLIWGSNGLDTAYGVAIGNKSHMNRIWKASETGTVGNVTVMIEDSTGAEFLWISDTADFSGTVTELTLTDNGTGYLTALVDLTDGQFFTFTHLSLVVQDDAVSTDEATIFTGNVLADNGAGADIDANGNPLTVTEINGDAGSVNNLVTLASGAMIRVDSDGNFYYDPYGAFDILNSGESNTDSFTYTLNSLGADATATVSVTIQGIDGAVNALPAASDDDFATDEVTTLTGVLFEDNGSGADTDTDAGDTLTIAAINDDTTAVGTEITLPSGALLTVNADGTLIYNPNGSFDTLSSGSTASDTFTYALSDGTDSDIATVSITINGLSEMEPTTLPPVASNDVFDTDEDTPVSGNIVSGDNGSGLDVDDDGDILNIIAVNGESSVIGMPMILPSGAELTVQQDGSFTYTPGAQIQQLNTGDSAVDSFIYTIDDGNYGTDIATVTINISGTDDILTVNIEQAEISENGGASFASLARNPGTAGDLTVTLTSQDTSEATVPTSIIIPDGSAEVAFIISGVDDTEQDGSKPVLIIAEAAGFNAGSGSLDVTDDDSNPPVPQNDILETDKNTVLNGDLLADNGNGADTDPNTGDTLAIKAISAGGTVSLAGKEAVLGSGLLTVNADGTFSFNPNGGYAAMETGDTVIESFTYLLTDGIFTVSSDAAITISGITPVMNALSDFTPAANALNIATTTAITVTFPEIVDETSINNNTLYVLGSLSGLHTCTFAGGGTDTVTCTPDSLFEPGENINVIITTGIINVNGSSLENTFSWQFTISAASGSGIFADSGLGLGISDSVAASLGDVDGDGDLDIVVANEKGKDTVWLNDGTGSFTDSGVALGKEGTRAMSLADVDGDGDLDVFLANSGDNAVWINDGTGNFTDSGQIPGSDNTGVTMGDIDGDGDIDAFLTASGANSVMLNDGTGIFTNSGQTLGNAFSTNAALADVDGDGDIDAFVTNAGSDTVWLNDGTGNFTDSAQALGINSNAVAMGDFDGDGDLDAFIAGFGPNTVWFNDGTGIFTSSGQTLGNKNSMSIALGDFDGDGDLDAFIANASPNTLWVNDGTGNFTDSGQILGDSDSMDTVLGDFNGDGTLEVFTANTNAQPDEIFSADKAAEYIISAVSGDTAEDGTTATFTISLATPPAGELVLDITSSDTGEGTVVPSSLNLTAYNWNAVHTVTITGADDDLADGTQLYSVLLAVNAETTDTGGYAEIDPSDVNINNTDNETAGFTVSSIGGSTSEDGTSATFTVKLNTQPDGDVIIDAVSLDTGEGTALPASLTFTGTDWNLEQTVTVTGADDDITDGSQSYIIKLTVNSDTDDTTGYAAIDAAELNVSNTDNDGPGFTLNPISGPTGEDGTGATFTVKLNSQPDGSVVLDVSSSDTGEGTVSPATLSFTDADWNTAQTVTITGVDDNIADGNQLYIIQLTLNTSETSDTTGYAALDPAEVNVSNTDNEAEPETDTDADGMPDSWETDGGLDPNNPSDAALDRDGDGISNLVEFINGTNPASADTDEDGLDDAAEIAAGTDPNDSDSDNDGVTDGAETAAGTDPLDNSSVDTDADGMPDNWETANDLDPNEPSDAAADTDGDGISNLEEFINGTDPASADTDGDGLDDAAEIAAGTDPNDSDSDNDGVSDGAEIAAGTDPLDNSSADTDADGMPDNWETANGLDPNEPSDAAADTDGDGISNLEEFINGTDPASADTDGDGLDDAAEIAAGTNPADASDSDPANITDTDSDGMPDWWEEQQGLNPADASDAAVDSDNDGISNLEEIAAGTDPNDSDSDNDGVSDGTEAETGTDPLDNSSTDTDADGMLDNWETANGFDPNNPSDAAADSDSDGISNLEEFINGTDSASADTDGDGVDDVTEIANGTNPADASDSDPANITDTDGDGMPDWWEEQQGLNPADASDATVDSDNDGISNLEEIAAGTDPNDSDSDNDGVSDGDEVETGTDPLDNSINPLTDTDADGLPDYWETANGLNPDEASDAAADSDGDGYSNLTEFNNNTNPNSSDIVQDDIEPDIPVETDSDNDGLPNTWENQNGLDPYSESDATSDSDGDGRNNLTEFNEGTDPNTADSPDSDADGMPDWWELQQGLTLDDPADAQADNDGDGISNLDEFTQGTDPNVPETEPEAVDSDNDGISDEWEIGHGLNPDDSSDALADSDNDGISNLDEFTQGTDPNVPDTEPEATPDSDNDGILDEWEIGHGLNPDDPSDALADSDNDGISNLDEFIQGTDPNVPETEPKPADSDNDGILDEWEIEHGLNPDDPSDAGMDSDDDGLNNLSEYINGINPMNPDSDNDGVSDGIENRQGSDPLDNSISGPDDVVDTDKDGLPDWYETQKGLNPEDASDAAGDTDKDGVNDLSEFINGTDLNNFDSDGDGISDKDEQINGTDPVDRSISTPEDAVDTDGDSLPDWYETANGLNPEDASDAYADSDNDGVFNLDEFAAGTSLFNADSDGDGFSDRAEADAGTDPLNTDLNPSTDSDNDGMPDVWEKEHGLNPDEPEDANADSDQDGISNLDEYINGTDPLKSEDLQPDEQDDTEEGGGGSGCFISSADSISPSILEMFFLFGFITFLSRGLLPRCSSNK
ncbi:FG-GAP-like repeat-containing protein [Desulfobacterales bacterium HSG17]|nr:FG-GAP-like repeat-containing protein [Desulfobacterales bacterium HSG17]